MVAWLVNKFCNFGFGDVAALSVEVISNFRYYDVHCIHSLKMAASVYAESLHHLQDITQLNPETRSYSLDTRSRKPREKNIMNVLDFYGTRWFITVFTKARHWPPIF
jgi:hypothetical protein